jgi:lysophospholipase L1-like esterase
MRVIIVLAATISLNAALIAADGKVLDSMDALSFQQPKEKAKIEIVDGKDGKALKFSFENECRNAFCFSKIKGSPEWDSAAGISFWVKGDGSEHLGGIQFVWNEDFGLRYGFSFPIDGTEWKKVVVPWRDLIPETCAAGAKPLGANGNAPSKLGAMWLGKWWYWKDYAAHSYTIDDIRLEAGIELPAEPAVSPGLQRVAAKLKAGQPITVVTMGDSLTDFAHWANKPINWPTLFKEKVKEKFKSEVTLINPAMGGTELRQNLVVMPRWLKQAPEPDLVTICFGYNDWHSGMRAEMYQQTLEFAIDRVRRMTNGKADVLIISSCRALEKWDTFAELVEAAKKAAAAKNAGFADIFGAFEAAGKTDRETLYCKDHTHLGPRGHETVAKTVIEALENAVK